MASERVQQIIRDIGRGTVRAAAMATADARVLPDLVIIGVKRGGTTSLFRDLEGHPSMAPLVPSARRLPLRENMKGVHFFDTSCTTRSPRWYRSHFPARLTMRRLTERTGAAFTAEASPYYLFHPLAAERAVRALPAHTVFAVLLRDPVERTVSHWAEQTRNGVERLTLDEAIDAEDARLGDAAHRLADGSLDLSHAHEQQSYASQSLYTDSLERWFAAAGRDRVVVQFSEDYYRDAPSVMAAVTDALGVGPVPVSGEHRNAAPRPGRLDPELDERLTERFRPDVDRVAALLGVTPPWPRFFPETTASPPRQDHAGAHGDSGSTGE